MQTSLFVGVCNAAIKSQGSREGKQLEGMQLQGCGLKASFAEP
jgi:hypothetical protein